MDPTIPPAPSTLLPTLSAEEVHRNIIRCHRLKSRVHRKLLGWIAVLVERKYSGDLGSPGPVNYVMTHLKYERSEAYDVVDVASALPEIPRTADAFEAGAIGWSQVKAIASVATQETEERWIEFARAHRVEELRAEARDARQQGRKLPRRSGSRILDRPVTLAFRMPLTDRELARKALERMAAVMKAGGVEKEQDLSPEKVFLAMCEKVLGDPENLPGETERARSIYDLVVHACPNCKEGWMGTGEGPVAVTPEYIQGIEGSARKLEISPEDELLQGMVLPEGETAGDVPEEVMSKVLALYGNRCAHCGQHLGLHVHHVIFRSRGGSNALKNLVPTCHGCHQSLHASTLEVFLDSQGNLIWRTKADKITRLMEEELKELAAIPAATVAVAATVVVPRAGEVKESVEVPAEAPAQEDPVDPMVSRRASGAVEVMVILGYPKKEAREKVRTALELLGSLGRAPTGDEILNTALRGRVLRREELSARAESGTRGGTQASREGNGAPEAGDPGEGPEGCRQVVS